MATAVEPPIATKTKGKILIVDDELVVRDSLSKWFVSEGFAARPVGGAREALEVIQQAEFDIALLDIKMPGMDGMELQARLREMCIRDSCRVSSKRILRSSISLTLRNI